MLARLLRILIGFALACVAAAVTLVAFVYAPADLMNLSEELNGERLSEAGFFAMLVTPHVLISAAVPAMLAAAFAETRKVKSWLFYAAVGVATSGAGFLVQSLTEPPMRLSILQTYALIAFLTAGLIGGLVYWALSGRYAAQP
jgi:protein-S-isoprenylcysteine O-methyltransferase Ste14